MQGSADTEAFLEQFVYRFRRFKEIDSIALAGSHAAGTAGPGSDIDLVILCPDPDRFTKNTAWIHEFGTVLSPQTECWGRLTALRVHYSSGMEVEFGFSGLGWADLPPDAGSCRVVNGGFRILLDKNERLAGLVASCRRHQ